MLKITVQLANGDRVDFTAADEKSPWFVANIELLPNMQALADQLYSCADILGDA